MTLSDDQCKSLLEYCRFATPLPRSRSKQKTDAGFLDPAYKKWSPSKSNHQGEDWNGSGGGDTDLGLPVRSEFPGTVKEIDSRNGWGLSVLVSVDDWVRQLINYAFRLHKIDLQLDVFEASYHHLHHWTIEEGQRVEAGWDIGSIGKGDKGLGWFAENSVIYTAHLHREYRHKSMPCLVRQSGRSEADIKSTHFDPALLRKFSRFSDRGNIQPLGERFSPYRLADVEDASKPGVLKLNSLGDKLYGRYV